MNPKPTQFRKRPVVIDALQLTDSNAGEVAPQVTEALEALYARPLQTLAERRLRSALRTRPSDDDLGDLLVLLHRDENLVVPDAAGADPIRIVCTMGVSKA